MDSEAFTSSRDLLLQCFHAALDAVHGRRVVEEALRRDPIGGPVHLVALGKAAGAMGLGAVSRLGDGIARGLVVTRRGYGEAALARDERFACLEADHPLPGASSLAAGRALLDFIASTPRDGILLFLISGGSSSLVEVLPSGLDLEDLRRMNAWLLASGLDIHAVNRVRSEVSCIKAGRLRAWLDGRDARALLMSDVPGDDPAVIGSGLLAPPRLFRPLPELPPDLQSLLARAVGATGTVEPCRPVPLQVIAMLQDACRAAEQAALARSRSVFRHDGHVQGDALQQGERLARMLLQASPGVYIWGGETGVRLPVKPGLGGRNQHLALAAARVLNGRDDISLLVAGTDGSDGNTEVAGAIVDGGTIQRACLRGLDPDACLAAADSHRFLRAAGNLVHTGPTGTNVMDIMIGVKHRGFS